MNSTAAALARWQIVGEAACEIYLGVVLCNFIEERLVVLRIDGELRLLLLHGKRRQSVMIIHIDFLIKTFFPFSNELLCFHFTSLGYVGAILAGFCCYFYTLFSFQSDSAFYRLKILIMIFLFSLPLATSLFFFRYAPRHDSYTILM